MLLSNLHELYEFNEPARADYYAMQVAQWIKLTNAKKGLQVKLSDMKIEREFQPQTRTVEEATRLAKAAWAARLPGVRM